MYVRPHAAKSHYRTACCTQAESAQRQLSCWLRGLITVHGSFGSANASLAKFFREQALIARPPRAAHAPKQAPPGAAFAPFGAPNGGGQSRQPDGLLAACVPQGCLLE